MVMNLIIGEAGWTPDQWGHSRFKSINASTDNASNQKSLNVFMRSLLKASVQVVYFSFFLLSFSKLFKWILKLQLNKCCNLHPKLALWYFFFLAELGRDSDTMITSLFNQAENMSNAVVKKFIKLQLLQLSNYKFRSRS